MIVHVQVKLKRDIKKISDPSVLKSFSELVRLLQKFSDLKNIPNTKRIHGAKHYYRYRIRDYRVWFRMLDWEIYIERFLHRKDIYKVFP